jgi:hypothetical protein
LIPAEAGTGKRKTKRKNKKEIKNNSKRKEEYGGYLK